jgi:hypothetical protein
VTAVALTAALVALAVSVLALLIVVGLARRLRAGGLALTPAGASAPAFLPPTGIGVPEFQFIDADGAPVSSARLASGRHAMAFVSSACDACRDSLPEFLGLADTVGADHSLAVFTDDGEDRGAAAAMLNQLRRRSTVLVEGTDREVGHLFSVVSFPTYVGVEDGIVQLSSHRIADLVQWHGT